MFNETGNPLEVATDVPATLRHIESLYDQGKLLQSYRLGEKHFGHPTQWPTVEGTILAGRLLCNLGAPRLGQCLHYKALRREPNNPLAIYYATFTLLERRGPLVAIQHWDRHDAKVPASFEYYADWLALRASLASNYRDFETAEQFMTRAEQLAPDRPWLRVERARLLEAQDQYEKALEAARSSLELHPWFRSGVHQTAHLLQVLDRDQEAVTFLEQAAEQIESALVCQQLATLQDHLHRYDAALKTLADVDSFCPINETKFQQNLAWLKSNVSYHAGDFSSAANFAEQSKQPFMLRVAEQLRTYVPVENQQTRVQLEFPFVRQHYMTCAPATMAAIGRFFSKPADHLAVVDAICYDGTSSHSQRQWAVDHGWVAREFTLTWDSAVALIDRGVPFTLATRQITSGHLQAIIGYDRMRATLLCRDPYQYYVSEFHTQLLIEHQASNGPRAMVMVPADRADLLNDLNLPDTDAYDLLFIVEQSLTKHDRPAAIEATDKLSTRFPEHRLTYHAQWALAAYDANRPAILEAVEALLKAYPKDSSLLFFRASLLRSLERIDLLIPALEQICGEKNVDATFAFFYADLLRSLHRDLPLSQRLLKRALRRNPSHPKGLDALADQLWLAQRREEAVSLYQLSASLQSLNEGSLQTYFNACRYLHRTEPTLALMKKRFHRLIARSSQPLCSYFWALESVDRTVEAFDVLEQGLQKRPDDGALMLYAADAYGRRAKFDQARELLKLAQGKTHRTQWLRCDARLCSYEGDLLKSLEIWQQVLDAEPLAQDANREVASLIAQTQSPQAAAEHLAAALERFPFNTDLAQLRIIWLRSHARSAVAEAAAALVEKQPGNVWAHVELSLALVELGKNEEALAHADIAVGISPNAGNALFARANVLERLLKLDEAREIHRQNIRNSVDYTPSVEGLLGLANTVQEKRQELDFIYSEIRRQVIFGQALTTYRKAAATALEPALVLDQLQQVRADRPDLWEAWSSVIMHLAAMSRLDEAADLAKQATERFPLLPRMWYDQSHIAGLQGNRPAKIAALRQCLAMSPGWSIASRQLADTYRLEGDEAQALSVLERAIPKDPLDAHNYHAYGWLLWSGKNKEKAIEQLKRALTLNPWINEAWDNLHQLMRENQTEGQLIDFVRTVCRQRAGEAGSWMILARMLSGPDTMVERMAAVESAIKLSPLDDAAHDLKAMLLVEQKEFDQALIACDPPQFAGKLPVSLRGRRAWIYARQNDIPRAIAAMREILQTNHSYYWGWFQLVNWLARQSKPAEYLLAAEEMLRYFPHDDTARNHFAAAQLQSKDRKTAKQTLASAVQLSPDNQYALTRLFDAQLNDKEFAAAAETLGHIEHHLNRSEFLARRIMLAAAQKNAATATEAMTELCQPDHFDLDALTRGVKAMDQARLQSEVNRVLNSTCTGNPQAVPQLVGFWAKRAASSQQWASCRSIMDLFADNTPQWLEAAIAYLSGLTQAKRYTVANRFIRQRHKRGNIPTRLWGHFGYAYFSQGNAKATIRALSDWAFRSEVQPWMLLNLADAYRRTNRFDLANPVQKTAVTLPEDLTTLKHRVWLALDEVTAGRTAEHVSFILTADVRRLDQAYPFLMNLVRTLAAACKNPPSNAGEFRTLRRSLNKAAMKVPGWKSRREVRLALRACIGQVLRWKPSLINRLWKLRWRMNGA